MKGVFLLALKDLKHGWALALVLAIMFGVTFSSFLALITYEQSQKKEYGNLSSNWLVVGSSNGFGEIYGSRLGTDMAAKLIELGYPEPVPEIRELIGTRASRLFMLRGVSLDDYARVTPFKLKSGRALNAEEPGRYAMAGEVVARNRDLQVGSPIVLKGHRFTIVGIFETGGLEDNQVWISLEEAQDMLDYGSDVSIYLIPDSGTMQTGDLIRDGVSVSQKGENGKLIDRSVQAFFRFVELVAILAGIACVLTMTNLLWRLAYLHRREFGILKTLGFRLNAFLLYFSVQAGIILGVGFLIGLAVAFGVLFKRGNRLTAFGYGLPFMWDPGTLVILAGVLLAVFCVGVLVPLLNIRRTIIPDLLGRN